MSWSSWLFYFIFIFYFCPWAIFHGTLWEDHQHRNLIPLVQLSIPVSNISLGSGCHLRGHQFMTSTKKSCFWPPSHLSTWARPPLWTSTCGRHEIHIALFKWLVQWPSRPKAEIWLYDCNLFKTVLSVIYITNLYHRKISTFFSPKTKFWLKKRQIPCMRRRQYDVSGL